MKLKRIIDRMMYKPMNRIYLISLKHKRTMHIGLACIDEKHYIHANKRYEIDDETFIFDTAGNHRHYYYNIEESKPQKIFELNDRTVTPEKLQQTIKEAEMWTFTQDPIKVKTALLIDNLIPIIIILAVVYYMIMQSGIIPT